MERGRERGWECGEERQHICIPCDLPAREVMENRVRPHAEEPRAAGLAVPQAGPEDAPGRDQGTRRRGMRPEGHGSMTHTFGI